MARRLLQGRETTANSAVGAAPSLDLIHLDVQHYLREVGLLR